MQLSPHSTTCQYLLSRDIWEQTGFEVDYGDYIKLSRYYNLYLKNKGENKNERNNKIYSARNNWSYYRFLCRSHV